MSETPNPPPVTFDSLYVPIPSYVLGDGSNGEGFNKNDDEFVGKENFVTPDKQLIYHIHKDPRWKQVFDQFWKAMNERQPPGSG